MITTKRHLNNIVLCYHGCVRSRLEALTFREHFDDWVGQIERLRAAGYTFVKPSQYYDWFMGTWAPTTPIACCQIDDGLASADIICDWMVEQSIPFSLALIARRQKKRVPEDGFMAWDIVKKYVQTGFCELQSHTYNLHNLTLIKNADGAIEAAPVLEGPCWIDNGDVVYREVGDTRWWWDFAHIDRDTWGFPLAGCDPYNGAPITSTLTIKAKVSFTCATLRLWTALHRPYGAGYAMQVRVRVNGVTNSTVTINPTQYATRSQWVEREFLSVALVPFAVVAGNTYTLTFETLTQGNGALVIYAIPDLTGDFGCVTSCQSLTAGRLGADFADYPAGQNWPARPGIIMAASTGVSATESQYLGYVQDDIDAEVDAITRWLNPAWTEYANTGLNLSRLDLTVIPLCGSYGDGTLIDVAIRYDCPTSTTMETFRYKQTRHRGRRYACIVDVYIGNSNTGPWTKIARFTPNWADYKWTEFDTEPTALTGGATYWFRFATITDTHNDVYPLDYSSDEKTAESNDLTQYGMKCGAVMLLIDGPYLKRWDKVTVDIDEHWYGVDVDRDYYYYVQIDNNEPIVSTGFLNYPDTSNLPPLYGYHICAYPQKLEMADCWPTNVFETWTYWADRRVYGRPFVTIYGQVPATPLQLPQQIVYPFGSFYNTGDGGAIIKNVQDIAASLKAQFAANDIEAGYTIYPVRHDRSGVHREPDCRCTEYTIPRFLVYGDIRPEVTLGHIDAYTGMLFEDVTHESVIWHASMEPDPVGNATIRANHQGIDYLVMDAYFFDGAGHIVRSRLNDGGHYVEIASQTGSFTAAETVTGGTSGATATVVWANNQAGIYDMRVTPVSGTFAPGETITGGTSGATAVLGISAVIEYADDKGWLKARGKARLLIINNNLGTGEPDPVIGSHVVNNPATYIPLIVALLVADDWDGVVCNLEAVPEADRAAASSYYQQLSTALHAQRKLLHITAPARTGTDYDTGSEWWWGWCDHNAILPYVDAMKIMTYTETGPGTAPGPHAPDWFIEQTYEWVATHVDSRFFRRILVGCNAFGHVWPDVADTDADYVTQHTGMAAAFTKGAALLKQDGELTYSRYTEEGWFGGPDTIRRAVEIALLHGFGGISIWKADDGDIYECWPQYPIISRRKRMFVEEQFPAEWSWGAEGGPQFKTSVVSVDSGVEDRASSWLAPLWKFKLSRVLHSAEDNDLLRAFFMLRKGKGVGFRFKDWSDFSATAQSLGSGNGSKTAFQIVKRYQFSDPVNGSTSFYDRTIKKPVVGTVSVYLNGVLQSSGFTINYTTGVISFSTPPANGVAVTASFEFDVPVRFDADHLNVTFDQNYGLYAWSGVGFVELRR